MRFSIEIVKLKKKGKYLTQGKEFMLSNSTSALKFNFLH